MNQELHHNSINQSRNKTFVMIDAKKSHDMTVVDKLGSVQKLKHEIIQESHNIVEQVDEAAYYNAKEDLKINSLSEATSDELYLGSEVESRCSAPEEISDVIEQLEVKIGSKIKTSDELSSEVGRGNYDEMPVQSLETYLNNVSDHTDETGFSEKEMKLQKIPASRSVKKENGMLEMAMEIDRKAKLLEEKLKRMLNRLNHC